MPSGGYRKPGSPAPASGPGRLARRTDGGPAQKMSQLPDAAYGEQAAYQDAQRSAPMAMADGALSPSSSAPSSAPMDVTPFHAPSSMVDEPVTAGAPIGAGVGPEALGLPSSTQLQQQDAATLINALPAWEFLANLPGASPSTRAIVRKIKSMVSGY